jgi:hypothetical protein
MPNNLTDAQEVVLLDASVTTTDKMALVSTAGTDAAAGTEVTGGSYARQTTSGWAAAATSGGNSTKATNAAINFAALAAVSVQGWEIWNSGGTTRKWYGLFSQQTGSAQASGDTVTITAHGLSNGTKIVFQSGYAPAGLTANTTYYVVGATTNTFQVAATSGGSAIDITADAISGAVVVGLVLDVAAGGTLAIASGAVVLSLS